MNQTQKKILMETARDTVEAVIKQQEVRQPGSNDPELTANCGCFVTLKNNEKLRGCIGQFTSDKPLIELIVDMAKASATSDPRFFNDPVTADELEQLDIEISVLSPLKRTDEPLSLKLGVDGVYIKKGGASGCFLPQVATETGWSKEEFLSHCCAHKAGLSADAWQDPETQVYLFGAEVFCSSFGDI